MVTEKARSVYDLISMEYGCAVSIEDPTTNLSIGVADLIIAQNSPRRVALVIINLSANVVYVKPGSPATTTSGIRLAPAGGSVSLNFKSDFHLPALEWHAIASGAASAIYITSVLVK